MGEHPVAVMLDLVQRFGPRPAGKGFDVGRHGFVGNMGRMYHGRRIEDLEPTARPGSGPAGRRR
jgi:hypothetical protein